MTPKRPNESNFHVSSWTSLRPGGNASLSTFIQMRDCEVWTIRTVGKLEVRTRPWRAFRHWMRPLDVLSFCNGLRASGHSWIGWDCRVEHRAQLLLHFSRRVAFFTPIKEEWARMPHREWRHFFSQRSSRISAVSKVFELILVCRCLYNSPLILPSSAVIPHNWKVWS
jgi:hypothetical protein